MMEEVTQKLRMSYSSSNTFLGCNRRFYYDKIVKADYDPDYNDDQKALRIGKAFHEVLELCHHEAAQLSKSHFGKSFEAHGVDNPGEQGMIIAMVQKYLILHKKSGLSVVGIELHVGDENIHGYIDAIMIDEGGHWWIVDLKTAGKLNGSLLSRLSRDPQLNIYSYYRNQVADLLKLDPSKFKGVRYRVTTKSTIKFGKRETLMSFAKRCFERIESYDIGVPREDLNPTAVYRQFMELLGRMRKLETTKESDIGQNFTYCESYFRPCPYWSRCYGKTFSAAAEQYRIFDSANIPDLSSNDDDDDGLLYL
jgi:hypothetical protein